MMKAVVQRLHGVLEMMKQTLGYSDEDRESHIRILAVMAGSVARVGGTAVVAAVTPTKALRDMARTIVRSFIEDFQLIHMTAKGDPLWEGTDYEEPHPSEIWHSV